MEGRPIVLVVDDEEGALGLFGKTLKTEDYTVLTANNGEEALELIKRERPNLVILNLKLSGMNEIEILRRTKRIDENIEVIIITGYGTITTAKMAMKLGAYDYITRPFNNAYIKAVIKTALSRVPENLVQLKLR